MTFRHTAVENRIATVRGRITVYFNASTTRISAYNNTDRMRTRIRPVLFVLGSLVQANTESGRATEQVQSGEDALLLGESGRSWQ